MDRPGDRLIVEHADISELGFDGFCVNRDPQTQKSVQGDTHLERVRLSVEVSRPSSRCVIFLTLVSVNLVPYREHNHPVASFSL